MRRWWCAGRRLLSSSSSVPVSVSALARRPLPPPVVPRPFPFSRGHLARPLPLGLLHPAASPPTTQVRHFATKDRSRAPRTPTTSKVKKYKIKPPSSMKFRFRVMNDGQVRRWRAGKRHNAHLKVSPFPLRAISSPPSCPVCCKCPQLLRFPALLSHHGNI
ncbi:hypothetical protein GUJ93_ZPchr0012g20449 [Zizania palustris]|uniref:50S ribosomal protein L35 n=1 Tax=Zizania palustris TaxID=103762 RepID=A0A8J6BTR7_ZIZPA|nr:hypothetical protein GUJ93_ZPchr0012g20449 [Zizania palustris]